MLSTHRRTTKVQNCRPLHYTQNKANLNPKLGFFHSRYTAGVHGSFRSLIGAHMRRGSESRNNSGAAPRLCCILLPNVSATFSVHMYGCYVWCIGRSNRVVYITPPHARNRSSHLYGFPILDTYTIHMCNVFCVFVVASFSLSLYLTY